MSRTNVAPSPEVVQPEGPPLARLQKLAAMGTMSAMLAHEFNNLLTPLIGHAQMALQRRDAAQMATALERVLRQARRAASLCDKILGMARDDGGAIDRAPLRQIAEDALDCLARDLQRDGIEVEIDIDPALCVRCVPAAIQQVLYNLLVNARQAMLDRGGRLSLAAEPTADGHVRLDVSDTGPGIDPAVLPRLFEPFFSTKGEADRPDRRGLGLGLTISRQLVSESGGELSVTSARGVGTTFTITLVGE